MPEEVIDHVINILNKSKSWEYFLCMKNGRNQSVQCKLAGHIILAKEVSFRLEEEGCDEHILTLHKNNIYEASTAGTSTLPIESTEEVFKYCYHKIRHNNDGYSELRKYHANEILKLEGLLEIPKRQRAQLYKSLNFDNAVTVTRAVVPVGSTETTQPLSGKPMTGSKRLLCLEESDRKVGKKTRTQHECYKIMVKVISERVTDPDDLQLCGGFLTQLRDHTPSNRPEEGEFIHQRFKRIKIHAQ